VCVPGVYTGCVYGRVYKGGIPTRVYKGGIPTRVYKEAYTHQDTHQGGIYPPGYPPGRHTKVYTVTHTGRHTRLYTVTHTGRHIGRRSTYKGCTGRHIRERGNLCAEMLSRLLKREKGVKDRLRTLG